MSFLNPWLTTALIVLILMTLLWLYSLKIKNSSIVDIFWGTGFVIVHWVAAWINSTEMSTRLTLLGVIVTIWGLRLSAHIYQRNHGQPEDFRYAAWRKEAGAAWWWRSLFKVFILQGVLMWIIAAPLIAALTIPSAPLNAFDLICAGVWLVGFIFEAGGDWQLKRFKSDPANKGKLLTTGLWMFTRHPNYFGDAMQWWGFYILSISSGGWWTVFSPIIVTFLLMKVSGVVMLEKTLVKTKPGYEDYIARTSAFFPWPPKK
jgi:steroid 5-alpha reductase family enzyme